MIKSSLSVFRVATVEACRFMVDCLQAAGANRKAAEQQAELLIQADVYGHPSHGMNRLGECECKIEIKFIIIPLDMCD